ncbi:MAG: M28 family peptidase [Candidatus Kapaibacterium sp.]
MIKYILIIFIIFAQTAFSYENETLIKIIGASYSENVSYHFLERICDEAGGRIAGSPEDKEALNILTEEAAKLGMEVKLEPFKMPGWVRGKNKVRMLSPAERDLRVAALGYVVKADLINAEIIDAKWGYEEDYEGIEPAGKILLIDQGYAKGRERRYRYEIINTAADRGALAILFINTKEGGLTLSGVSNFDGKPCAIPAYSLTKEEGLWIKRLLKRNIAVELEIETNSYIQEVETANAVITFPGETDSSIVIGAHIDSWDIGQGAIDNGQGSAVLFELARVFNQVSPRNHYSVKMVWFNGEELGLWGSKEYARRHSGETAAMINLDMTGKPTGINIMGFDDYEKPFTDLMETKLKGYNLEKGIDNNPWSNSDHIHFMFEGIPSFTFHGHLDKEQYWYYHDFGDTFDKANKEYYAHGAAVIGAFVYEMANNPAIQHRRLKRGEVIKLLEDHKLLDQVKRQKMWIYSED